MYEKEMKTGDLRFVPYKVINTSEVAGMARLVEYITVGGFVQEVLGAGDCDAVHGGGFGSG